MGIQGDRIKPKQIALGEVTKYEWDDRDRLIGLISKDFDANAIAPKERNLR